MANALFRPSDRPFLHLALLVATLGATFVTFLFGFGGEGGSSTERVHGALAFSFALVAILGSHEMGHYVVARLHGVDTSLPYFIPLPFLGVGTLGAVIRIRDRIPTREALVDIGAAGPLAGIVVALPLLFWGLGHSQLVDAPVLNDSFPGEGSLWTLLREGLVWLQSRWTGSPEQPAEVSSGVVQVFGDSLLMKGLQWLAVGPLPPGKDLLIHPVVVAGWFGLLVTLLNLLPIGQLDGGHLTFALWGARARRIGQAVALGLLFLTLFVSAFWLVWLVITTKLIGFGHPEVIDPVQPLSRSRKWVCALCLLVLLGCLMPIPVRLVSA